MCSTQQEVGEAGAILYQERFDGETIKRRSPAQPSNEIVDDIRNDIFGDPF